MCRSAHSLSIALLCWLSLSSSGQAGDWSSVESVFRSNCVKCHGAEQEVEGEVNLAVFDTAAKLSADLDLLKDLIEVLDSRTMPPEDEPELPDASREQILASLRAQLRDAISAGAELPRTPIRRMNRFQYNNAVQDLLELKVEVFTLPERMLRQYNYFRPETRKMPEELKAGSRPLGKSQLIEKRLAGVAPFPQDLRAEHGFDNRGDHLTLSPLLLESFLKLSRSIVESDDFHAKTCGIWDEFFATPDNESEMDSVVRERLHPFLSRAFRRHVGEQLLDRYAAHVTDRLAHGDSFTRAMKSAASAAIASPRFLYLYDRSSDHVTHDEPTDYELASRLSFFLWGSIPDDRLLELAASGQLRRPGVLNEQVDRMLDDARVKRFCDSFPSQWLQLERIISSVPDPKLNPEFYFAKYRLSMHMMLEPLLLFETVLVEDRPIMQLVDSDFSYRSEALQSWYRDGTQGKKVPPTAIPFQRVSVNDRREGGVITTAAVMTMTSGPARTQPITRGAWIASVVFNDPPEPPPADVPPLGEGNSPDQEHLTIRQRFASHREQPGCAGCHQKIDPLGFALENYGPTGLWRDQYQGGMPVDASGTLFGKHKFADIVEFKAAILTEKDRFTRALAEHLLSFALGREVAAADWNALDDIVRRTSRHEYRMREMLKSVAISQPFRQNSLTQ